MSKSLIWQYFKIAEDTTKAECLSCRTTSQRFITRGKTIKSFSTTPLWNHLKFVHPEIYKSLKKTSEDQPISVDQSVTDARNPSPAPKEKKQVTLESTLQRNQVWKLDDPKSKAITSKICQLMALDAEPFSIVNRDGFKSLIKHLSPRYPLPGRMYFQEKALPELFEKVENRIRSILSEAVYLSFTTDTWTSSINNESFISLTAHFFDHQMEQKVYTLNCKHFPGSHKGANIASILKDMLEYWKISPTQHHAIIHDNARNMTMGTGLLTTLESVSCFIHTLQLVIQDSILSEKSITDILSKSRKIVGHFSHSSVATTKLKEIQTNLKLPINKLIQDVVTRWNSTYYMLKRLYEQRQAVTAYAAESDIPTLTSNQWSVVENMVRVLQPFEEITNIASSDKETISCIIPSVETLKSYLSKRQNDEGVQTLKDSLKSALTYRFLNCSKLDVQNEKVYCIATALDPRYKFHFFSNPDKIKSWIISEINEHTENKGDEREHEVEKTGNLTEETHEDIWSCFSEIVTQSTQNVDEKSKFSKTEIRNEELEKYANSPLINRTENPILWWKNHLQEYPILKPLVLKYLSAPPSSATSERLFSSAKQIYTENRNRLDPCNAEKLLFIMRNMKMSGFEDESSE